MVGQNLAHYRVHEKIGAGGMGEVYRGTDTRLGRDVAIKILPAIFAQDSERLARFEREAQLLATLNHTNIAGIFGLEEANGVRFIVMELAPGETIGERLRRGSMPVEDALEACRQVAAALEAAHEKGILHRDLKPANVKITPQGRVKVLDFGLAKAFGADAGLSDLSHSPTITVGSTRAGVILGTAAYMSPEQARGRPVDKRTDVWAFGCLLFEMLTGKQAFPGDTVSDTISAILRGEPDWEALPATLPPAARRLLRRCLQKDATRRLQDMGDARLEIEDALNPSAAESAGQAPATSAVGSQPIGWRRHLPWALPLVTALLAAAAVWLLKPQPTVPNEVTRFVIHLTAEESLNNPGQPQVALSPDGKLLAYATEGKDGVRRIYLRAMHREDASPLAGTERAAHPFFSPDGKWIGFFAAGSIKKVSVQGGTPVALCDTLESRGGSWGADDTIVFANVTSGLFRVDTSGSGRPEALTQLDTQNQERTHRWPHVLPDNQGVLFVIGSMKSPDYYLDAQIAHYSFKTRQRKILPIRGTNPRYLSSGHIVYGGIGGLFAAPFDLAGVEVTGPAVPVLDRVNFGIDTGAVHAAFSNSGTLAYTPGSPEGEAKTLVWRDRKGGIQPLSLPPAAFYEPAISPDGSRLAVAIRGTQRDDVWIYEFERGTHSRLTLEGSGSWAPVWTPDSKRIIYATERDGKASLYWRLADGSGPEELLMATTDGGLIPESVSPDGQLLVYTHMTQKTAGDLWILPLRGERKPRLFIQSELDEWGATFSPDGRWIAYVVSEPSGSMSQVYVQPFPGPGGKWQVSTTAGTYSIWSKDGREIFYRDGLKLMSAAVTTQPTFKAAAPRLLFENRFEGMRNLARSIYAPMPDGQRFVLIKGTAPESASREIHVVLNWTEELKTSTATAGNK